MIDEHKGDFQNGEPTVEASPGLSRRMLLSGLFALPIAALDAGAAEAQYIGFGPFRLHLGPSGGYGGGGGYYRTRPPARHVTRHHHNGGGGGGGARHASRRGRHGGGGGGGGGDTGGASTSSATGLGKADY